MFPKHVEFENSRNRVKSVTLFNNSNQTKAYKIFLRNYKTVDGKQILTDNPDEAVNPLNEHIKISPRKIVIPAGKSVKVKILLRPKKKLKAGEYTARLTFKEDQGILAVNKKKKKIAPKESALSFNINFIFSISIPVKYYVGKLPIKIKVDDKVKLEKNKFTMKIQNTGKRSVSIKCTFKQGKQNFFQILQIENIKNKKDYPVFIPNNVQILNNKNIKVKCTKNRGEKKGIVIHNKTHELI